MFGRTEGVVASELSPTEIVQPQTWVPRNEAFAKTAQEKWRRAQSRKTKQTEFILWQLYLLLLPHWHALIVSKTKPAEFNHQQLRPLLLPPESESDSVRPHLLSL